MPRLRNRLKRQAENQIVSLLLKRSKDISFQQITGLCFVICFCYFFSIAHTLIPSFLISYYDDSETFIWNLGLVFNLFTQTTFLYIGTFFRGKTVIYTVLTSFNSFLFIGVLPFVFPSQLFELVSVLCITFIVYFLSKKLRNKAFAINSNDPITELIKQNSLMIECEYQIILTSKNEEEKEKAKNRIQSLFEESKTLIP